MGVPKTRLASMGAEERKRASADDNAMDTSVTLTGERSRAPEDVATYVTGTCQRGETDAARAVFSWVSLRKRK